MLGSVRPTLLTDTRIRDHVPPPLGIQIAAIEAQEDTLLVPSLVAEVLREVIAEQAPPKPATPPVSSPSLIPQAQTYTPFVTEPVYSGLDQTLHSSENQTTLTQEGNVLRVKCHTHLLPFAVPVQIYLTGRELHLPIAGQRCTVDVFGPEDPFKLQAVVKEAAGATYLEVQKRGKPWVNEKAEEYRLALDTMFTL